MATQKEVATQASKQKIVTVYDFLEQKKDLIAKALPASITPERLIGVFTMVLRSSPELAKCSQMSLISAVIQTVQLGLTPGNIGHCYFIPFKNKGNLEVQFVIGYKGIVEMLNRCGKATLLSTEIVREGDHFEHELGLEPKLKHIPAWDGETQPIRGVYCVAKNLVANEKVFVYMDKSEIDKVRAASKAGQSEYSPWAKWYEEMAKKTVVKRICKLLPLSVEDQRKVAQDETIKDKIDPDMASVKDNTQWDNEEVIDVPADKQNVPHETLVDPETGKTEDEVAAENGHIAEPPPAADPIDRSKCISDKQRKRLFAIGKTAGWDKEAIDTYLRWEYNIESMNDIPWGDTYDKICKHIEENPATNNAE